MDIQNRLNVEKLRKDNAEKYTMVNILINQIVS